MDAATRARGAALCDGAAFLSFVFCVAPEVITCASDSAGTTLRGLDDSVVSATDSGAPPAAGARELRAGDSIDSSLEGVIAESSVTGAISAWLAAGSIVFLATGFLVPLPLVFAVVDFAGALRAGAFAGAFFTAALFAGVDSSTPSPIADASAGGVAAVFDDATVFVVLRGVAGLVDELRADFSGAAGALPAVGSSPSSEPPALGTGLLAPGAAFGERAAGFFFAGADVDVRGFAGVRGFDAEAVVGGASL
jgi:hypothetical protein